MNDAEADKKQIAAEQDSVLSEFKPKTQLGRDLLRLRKQYVESGGELLDAEGLDKELQEMRGLRRGNETENGNLDLLARILAVHMRTAEPARYAWATKPGWFTRIWRWLREDSDWDGRQW